MLTTKEIPHDHNNRRLLQNLHLTLKAPVASSYIQATSGHSGMFKADVECLPKQTSCIYKDCLAMSHNQSAAEWVMHDDSSGPFYCSTISRSHRHCFMTPYHKKCDQTLTKTQVSSVKARCLKPGVQGAAAHCGWRQQTPTCSLLLQVQQ